MYSSLFVNLDLEVATVELSGLPQHPELSGASPVDLVNCLHEVVIPVTDAFAEPHAIVTALPESWLSMVEAPMVEWAIACGDAAAASELIVRHLGRPLKGEQTWGERIDAYVRGWEIAATQGRPEQPALGIEALGWLAAVHSLVEPQAIAPPTRHSLSSRGAAGWLRRRRRGRSDGSS